MKVFRLTTQVNRYQVFAPVSDEAVFRLRTDGETMEASWQPPAVFLTPPSRPRGDFLCGFYETMITSPRATVALLAQLQAAGEVLPLPFEGETYALLNVTNVVDCLDLERAVTYPYVKSYVFKPDVLAELPSPIFKIPQTVRSEILVVEGLRNYGVHFQALISHHGLKGAMVSELWSDER